MEHIRGHLWHIFHSGQPRHGSNREICKVMTSTLPRGTLGSVASLLAASLYQGNPDRNHNLWNTLLEVSKFQFVIFSKELFGKQWWWGKGVYYFFSMKFLIFQNLHYSQRQGMINHCDRHITLLSDTDIYFVLFNLSAYFDMPFGWNTFG